MKSEMGMHAEEVETSICLVAEPDQVNLDKATREYPTLSLSSKWATPDFYGMNKCVFHQSRVKGLKMGESSGVMGDATAASRETGEKIINVLVDELLELIVEIIESEHL